MKASFILAIICLATGFYIRILTENLNHQVDKNPQIKFFNGYREFDNLYQQLCTQEMQEICSNKNEKIELSECLNKIYLKSNRTTKQAFPGFDFTQCDLIMKLTSEIANTSSR